MRLEQFDKVFDMWSFAGAPSAKVAYRDGGYAKLYSVKPFFVIHIISYARDEPI